ncbi:uncharacterized protein LOC113515671 [Galleria mellonella]|uniref:Uncharacterized protein LOC113515671 n=1 Tax=Galleria mellonella TaxID=7137 RepID=A0A6J1WLM5_GALME|nr:uncharacterized protein LOC113515671 [Galleria mellonella]
MAKLKLFFLFLICCQVHSETVFESSYNYFIGLGKSLAPSFMNFFVCMTKDDVWSCAKDNLGKVLDGLDEEVQKERKIWQEDADAEVRTSGRSIEEMPSKIGRQVEESLFSIGEAIEVGIARAMSRKKHEGGIDSITISTGMQEKKKKKKPKPPKIHLVHPAMMAMKKDEKGRGFPGRIQSWVIGDQLRNAPARTEGMASVDNSAVTAFNSSRKARNVVDKLQNDSAENNGMASVENSSMVQDASARKARNMFSQMMGMKSGDKMMDAIRDFAMNIDDNDDAMSFFNNGNMNSAGENRSKKKKKRKAILKLLLLGAVLKAKIGTILQILSFKLQVKFFIIALLGLGINLARLWIEIKNKHKEHPQKIIYYEHAQHQHHYDHEEEHGGWGPWSRSMEPPEADIEIDDLPNSPYAAQERPLQYYRPLLTKD